VRVSGAFAKSKNSLEEAGQDHRDPLRGREQHLRRNGRLSKDGLIGPREVGKVEIEEDTP